MKRLLLLALFVCIVSVGAFANTISTALPVTAFLQSSVSVNATDLVFGNFTLPSSDIPGTGSIFVTATSGVGYSVTLNAGQHLVAGVRNVNNGTNGIPYKIWVPGSLVNEWGDTGFGGTYVGSPVTGTGNGLAQQLAVNGTLSLNGLVGSFLPGLYWDFVVVTVNF